MQGEFSLRGEVLDVFVPQSAAPCRIISFYFKISYSLFKLQISSFRNSTIFKHPFNICFNSAPFYFFPF
ncbi:MAG: hypothetical protein ACFNPZ_08560 [Fusobacterium polymorphum]